MTMSSANSSPLLEDYIVVEAYDLHTLKGVVTGYLRAGWYCQGGVTVESHLNIRKYLQALRYKPKQVKIKQEEEIPF